MSKLVGITACVLAYLLNSSSGLCHEVSVSEFPILHNFKDTVHHNEACLHCHLTGVCLRLSDDLSLACPSLQPL